MNPNQISVLIYGHEPHVLESRKWVLQSCGYRALSVRYLSEIARVPLQPPIDLLVLDSTLTAKECERAIAQAQLLWPGVKALALVRHTGTRQGTLGDSAPVLKQVVKAVDAPAPLLSSVGELVGHAVSSSYSHTY
jgi:hypothetical protein